MAASAVRSLGSSLGKNLREIRLHLCQTSAASKGVRSRDRVMGKLDTLHIQGEPEEAFLLYMLHMDSEYRGSFARDFVEQNYVTLKKANLDFPILIRECSGVQARLWVRYGLGKETSVLLDNMSADQVAKALQSLAQSKP